MTVKWMWIFVFMVFILNHAHGQVVVRDSVEVMPDPTTIRANSVQGLGKYECDFSFGFSLNRDADNRYVLYNNENELVSTCTFDAGRTQVNLSGYPIPWNLSFTAGLIEISHPNRSIRIWANEDVSTEGYMLVFFRMWADQLEVRLGFFNSLGYGSFPDTHPGDNVYIAMVRYYWMDQGYTPQEVKVICDYEYEVTFNDVPITFHIDNARTGLYALNTTENPPALRHNGISTISIIAEKQFPEDPEPSITEDSLLDFKMDDGCEQYGSLIGSDGQKVKTLTGITYGSARQGGVKFIADGIQPEQEETAFILFTERVRPDCPHYSFVTLLPSDSLSFNVTFSKDTLRHSESSSVFVQAMKNGEPIEPLEGTRLFFSMDSNGQKYGSLRLPDSTIVHPDMSIPYADAISGKIKFFTDGKEPDSTANVMINVINTEEPAWSGSGHVSIGADSILLAVKIPVPKEIWPTLRALDGDTPNNISRRTKDNIQISMTRNGEPVPNQNVIITVEMILPSGGHDHTNQPPMNLRGHLRAVGADAVTVDGNGTVSVRTNAEGHITATYTASEFGGKYQIIASSHIGNLHFEDRDTIIVIVPQLVLLQNDVYYDKVGGNESHHGPTAYQEDHNHWGTNIVIENLQSIAMVWFLRYYNEHVLMYNDISLVNGGIIDNGQWQQVHLSHRKGTDTDVRTGLPGSRNGIPVRLPRDAADWHSTNWVGNPTFERICRTFGGTAHRHFPNSADEHYHIDF